MLFRSFRFIFWFLIPSNDACVFYFTPNYMIDYLEAFFAHHNHSLSMHAATGFTYKAMCGLRSAFFADVVCREFCRVRKCLWIWIDLSLRSATA